jgi:hypothetical protein
VTVASIHLPDWALLGLVGLGPLTLRGARTIREARGASARPLLVVGHSMGGIIARLAMSDVPLEAHRGGVADDVGCLVTLGTPHRMRPRIPWQHPAARAVAHLARVAPGASHAPRTTYLTVGSTRVAPAQRGPVRTVPQLLSRALLAFVGETAGEQGDGLVGNDLCQLEGVPHIALPDALHGTLGGPWYGDDAVLDRWWPAAVDGWHAALEARAVGHAPADEPPISSSAGSSRAERPAHPR